MTALITVLRIDKAANFADLAALRLQTLLEEHCPGPHRYVQHRDGRMPWCPRCGYQSNGRPAQPRTGDTAGKVPHRRQQSP